MYKYVNLIIFIFLLFLTLACNVKKPAIQSPQIVQEVKTKTLEYPQTLKDMSVVDDYHGTEISDPYRWLEDDHSEETMDWVKRQNKVTFSYLDQIPFRGKIKNRLSELWNYEKFGSPFKEGDYYYFFKNDGLQNQSVLYRIKALGDAEEMVLDPNSFSTDGTTALGGIGFDKSGKYLAYQLSEGGSDWRTVFVMDLESKELLTDKVEWVKFSGISWYKDGFYYSRYPAPSENDELSAKNEYHKVYYHKLGTDQADDKLIIDDPNNAQRNFGGYVTDDERYLIVSSTESTSGNALYVKDLTDSNAEMITIKASYDDDFSVIDNFDNHIIAVTNVGAPNQKVVSVDVNNPDQASWKTLIPESENALRGVSHIGGKLFAYYLYNASSKIEVYDKKGNYLQELELPGIGTVGGISGKSKSNEAFFVYTSFIVPATIYKLNTETLDYEVFRKPNVKFDSDNYVSEQVWFTSKDGTKVPMFVTYKKGIVRDGSNPTLLYGYGGFDIPIPPSFRVSRLPILENGGIYVVANIRGGGEFGQKWHKAGTLGQKQNVFDDFQAAAEHLIAEKYTSSDKLAIQGGSNGGLLVGACMTQRPDLFQVAFPAVGVLDMLRYHKFTIGWAWATDYGRSDDPEAFDYLIEYSPLHNVEKIAYPATLVTTADHDDRVVPAHSFKFISELQDKHVGDNPVLIRIETSAGHGAGKSTEKQIQENADIISFMFYNMGEDIDAQN